MSLRAEYHPRVIGSAALAALRLRAPARVFASFERSFYVETPSGIACIGGRAIGRGPLNVIVDGTGPMPAADTVVTVDCASAMLWAPSPEPMEIPSIPEKLRGKFDRAWRHNQPAQAFLAWLAGGAQGPATRAANALIGLGPGLTPAGDDFVGGALIALRASGRAALANRVSAWALALAEEGTGKISRAHLRCAAEGEGHEALHELLSALQKGKQDIDHALAALARIGHSSGLDAAAGALLSLAATWHVNARATAKAAAAPQSSRYRITSSTRASTDCGISRPRALAVLRLTTK